MQKRLFFSIILPDEVKTEIKYHLQRLKNELNRGVKWVDKKNLHITILFLGLVKEELMPDLVKRAEKVRSEKFSVKLVNISYFPKKENAKIIWINLNGKGIKRIAKMMKNEFGLRTDETFIPHITLGRIKKWEFKNLIDYEIPDIDIKLDIEFDVSSFELMESKLKKAEPEYIFIKSFNLR